MWNQNRRGGERKDEIGRLERKKMYRELGEEILEVSTVGRSVGNSMGRSVYPISNCIGMLNVKETEE